MRLKKSQSHTPKGIIIRPTRPSMTRTLSPYPYPAINHPEAKQSKHSTPIENILILCGSSFNKSDRISAQSQCISRIQNLSLCILHISIPFTSDSGNTFKKLRCSTRLSNTAIPLPMNSSNCCSVLFKKVSSCKRPSSLVNPVFVRIRLESYGFSGVADWNPLLPNNSFLLWEASDSECCRFRDSNLPCRFCKSARNSLTRL